MPLDLRSFAQELYQRPGVEAVCLQLQAQGTDVCLLLCGAWLETRGVACTAGRCRELQQLAKPWRERVVEPLRRLRQAWREPAGTDAPLSELRERLKALELDAEWELLARLEAACSEWPATCAAASDWLECLTGSGDGALQTLRAATRAN